MGPLSKSILRRDRPGSLRAVWLQAHTGAATCAQWLSSNRQRRLGMPVVIQNSLWLGIGIGELRSQRATNKPRQSEFPRLADSLEGSRKGCQPPLPEGSAFRKRSCRLTSSNLANEFRQRPVGNPADSRDDHVEREALLKQNGSQEEGPPPKKQAYPTLPCARVLGSQRTA